MRVVLLMLLFMIWESSADALPSAVSLPLGTMLLLIGYCVLIGGMGLWARRVAHGRLGTYEQLGRRVDRFNLGMAAARVTAVAWFAVGVFALGWRHSVEAILLHTVGESAISPLVTPGVVIGLLPGFFGWAGLWWSQYPVDRAIREQGVLAQLSADLPVFAPPPFASYFANKLRVQILFTTVPVLMILSLRDVATAGLRAAAHTGRLGVRWPPSDAADSGINLVTVALVLLLVPAVLRHVLSTRPLPPSPLRDGLADVLAMAGVRCREVLLWQTHNNLGNAAVMGVIPQVRYVMLSDLLLESMTAVQVQAVFAHELGHVRHRHLAWFVGVLGTGIAALSVAGDAVAGRLHPTSDAGALAVQGGLLAVGGGILWVGYGLLSRWFERQADVYAARLMDRALPGAGGAAFAGALRRVAVVNNIPYAARNWTHGSIAARVRFIEGLTANPGIGPRFDRTGRRVRAGLVMGMVACAAVAVAGLAHG